MVAQESPLPDPQGGSSLPEPTEKETRKQTFITWIIVAVAAVVIAFGFPDSKAANMVIWAARFVATLGVLVFVHEWGHFQFARWAGMKVNRFALGFPPWIFTKRYKGIDYSIGALPIGGMVDIAGISEEEMIHTSQDLGVGTAATNVENVKDSDAVHAYKTSRVRASDKIHGQKDFQDSSLGWRFMTLFAGPMMNFVYTLVVAVALYSTVGIPDQTTVTNQVVNVQAGKPAFFAGLQPNDTILGVGDKRTPDHDKLVDMIRGFRGETMSLIIERNGQVLTKTLKPQYQDQKRMDGKPGTEHVAVVGVEFMARIDKYKRLGVLEAAQAGVLGSIDYASELYQLIGRAVAFRLTPQEKDAIGGPVAIAQAVNTSSKRGWYSLVQTSIMLSLNLGLMNLLPIPALDGGRIMFLLYELIARRPLDARKEGLVNMVGMLMVLSLMAFLTVRDVLPYITKGLHSLS